LLGDAGAGDGIQVGVEAGDAGGDVEVELVEVDVVTTPGEGFASSGNDHADDLRDRAGGGVVAGNPLGGDEGEGAGLDGEIDLGVEEMARGFGEVGGDADGGLLGSGGGEGDREEGCGEDEGLGHALFSASGDLL
jgi:hypothetical protein